MSITAPSAEGSSGVRKKVAVVTDDMKTISPHFGMARHYLVYEVEAGEIVGKETREKPGHGPGMHPHHGEVTPEMVSTHNSMLSNIADCDAVIARGMGRPMYSAIREAGMQAYITEIENADEAVAVLLAGRLENHLDLLH